MTLKYPVRVRHLIGKGTSVRFDPDQAFGEGLITAGAVHVSRATAAAQYQN